MNTKQLKDQFSEVYKDFFLKYPLVISMPFVMTWVGDYSTNFNGINIKQKIPLRIYVWVKYTNIKDIILNKITFYDAEEDTFVTEEMNKYSNYFQEIDAAIKEKYSSCITEKGWVELSLFSELPASVWLGFDSVSWMLLICGLERIKWTISHSKICEVQEQSLGEVWNNFHDILSPLFNTSYWYLINSYSSFPITGNTVTSFYNGEYPFVTFGVSQFLGEDYTKITYKWEKAHVFRFNELMGDLRNHARPPIDYWIIYSWQPVITEQVLYSNSHALDWIPKAKERIKSILKIFLEEKWKQTSIFYKNFLDDKNKDFENIYSDLLLVASLEVFNDMTKLYEKWYSDQNIMQFIASLNKFRYSNYVRCSSQWFFHFINEIEKHILHSSYIGLSPNDTTVMWWTVNFVLPLEKFRSPIKQWIVEVNKNHKWSRILYESWVDGIENHWIIFEQDIDDGIYSEFFGRHSFILRKVDWEVQIIHFDNLDAFKMDQDILVDKVNNKIVIAGKNVNSKELVSQSATIEILNLIIERWWEEIHCREFEASSYSKNKNEMLSKILIPLTKLIAEKSGKKLSINCQWTVEEFYIKCDFWEIKIGVLDTIKRIV